MEERTQNEFETLAARGQNKDLAGEFWYFIRQYRRWVLAPIILALLLLGIVMMLSTTAAAPFIYTLF